MRWECTECGVVVERPNRPAKCRRCRSSGAAFVAAEELDDETPEAETLYESWIRHGMRTTGPWRSHV